MKYVEWGFSMVFVALIGGVMAYFGIGEYQINFVAGVASLALLNTCDRQRGTPHTS